MISQGGDGANGADDDDRGDAWEHPADRRNGQGYHFSPVTAADLDSGDYTPHYLVRNVLVDGQPAVIGGPHKALKTSIGLDMAVALATATPFGGRFPVPAAKTVCFVSGESGKHTIQETARRICAARGLRLADIDRLHFDFRMPQLANITDRRELQRGIRAMRCDVVFVDPLYLSFGGAAVDAANVYAMGPLLLNVAQTCLDAGCTPILLHHFRTTGRERFGVPTLDDLAYSGIKEFARQWLLVNRRDEYVPGTGVHRLWLSVGGSIGHGGLWALDADEGQLDEHFRGRRWVVSVTDPGQARAASAAAADDRRDRTMLARERQEDRLFLDALTAVDPHGAGVAAWAIRKRLKSWSGAKITKVARRLIDDGQIEAVSVAYAKGNGTAATTDGYRRATNSRNSRTPTAGRAFRPPVEQPDGRGAI